MPDRAPSALSAAPPIIPPDGLFDRFAARIAALPEHTPLRREDLLVPEFLLAADGPLELYYAPFDYVNERARVVLIGIAPGWYQAELAHRTARDALRAGASLAEAGERARTTASFSGAIRSNLVAMLDGLGLHAALGLASCWELFGERADLLATSAVVRYPLFVRGGNYTGYGPEPLRHPLLRRFVVEALASELARMPRALVVPLGKSVAASIDHLVSAGVLEAERCLPGLPHPSGANAHRPAQFAAVQPLAAARVRDWFGA
ncbi:MAG: hypothetical protein DIU80_019475 [Chloroflexota bacterium]|nr:MAG: hypothetical protein DIU80_06920 [Chloroflexota bacterium]